MLFLGLRLESFLLLSKVFLLKLADLFDGVAFDSLASLLKLLPLFFFRLQSISLILFGHKFVPSLFADD